MRANTPSITLTWPAESKVAGFSIARKLRTDPAWTPLASLPGSATTRTDASVCAGVTYEYQIQRPITAPYPEYPYLTETLSGWGYLCTGINVPVVDRRGTVILVADDTMSGPLTNERRGCATTWWATAGRSSATTSRAAACCRTRTTPISRRASGM